MATAISQRFASCQNCASAVAESLHTLWMAETSRSITTTQSRLLSHFSIAARRASWLLGSGQKSLGPGLLRGLLLPHLEADSHGAPALFVRLQARLAAVAWVARDQLRECRRETLPGAGDTAIQTCRMKCVVNESICMSIAGR